MLSMICGTATHGRNSADISLYLFFFFSLTLTLTSLAFLSLVFKRTDYDFSVGTFNGKVDFKNMLAAPKDELSSVSLSNNSGI